MADGGEVKIKITGDDSQFKKTVNNLESTASKGLKKVSSSAAQVAGSIKNISASTETVVSSANKAKNAIQSFNRGWQDIKQVPNVLKNVGGNLKNNVVNGLTNAKLQTSLFAASLKTLGQQKLTGLVDSVKQFKTTITEGKSGLSGFTAGLKNIGKISVAEAVNGIKSLVQHSKEFAKTKIDGVVGSFKQLPSLFKNGLSGSSSLLSGIKKVAGVSLKGLHTGILKIGSLAKSAAGTITGALGGAIKSIAKGLTVAMAAGATAVTALVSKSVSAYSDYEQFVGGVETLFKDNAKTVQNYANVAYRTAGLSANQYMDTVTSFSASLIQSLGGDTAKAASMADMAIIDMSDNCNKMGTDMQSIQWAYQGFAKQNYTMLDNLKLGYGGTKEEMQRLLSDAEKLTGKKFDLSSFADIVEAIHAIQENMDITGTTAQEAEHTIQGSAASMKAAWQNMLVALITGGGDFDRCIDALVKSALTFGKNIMPAVESALQGVAKLIEGLAPVLSQIVTKIAKYAPKMIDVGVKLIQSFLNGISKNSSKIASAAAKICTALIRGLREIIPQITAIAGQIISAFANELGKAIPILTPITSIVSLIGDNLNSLIPIVVAAASSFATFQIITTVTTAVQSLITKFQAIQAVLTAYSTAAAASTITLKPLGVIIGVITGKISLAAAAQAAWNAIMSANPIMLIITALAALAVGIGVYVAATNKASDAELEHQKQVEASIERTNELKDSMESQKESYANSIQSTEESTAAKLSEMERTQELANELMTLADSEGNVAEKNRERVDFILGELNGAYGTEYALIDGQIQKYSELVDSINKVIEAEKAKALVSSYSSQLQEAYKNEAEAASGAKEATKELSGQYAEREAIIQEFFASGSRWNNTMYDEKTAAEYLSTAHGNLAKRYQEVDQAIKNNEEVIRYHAETEREVSDKEAQFSEASAQLKIGNYEKITQQASLSAEQRAAIASGEGAKIKEAIQANNEEIKMLEEARNTTSDESIRNYISKQIETLTTNGEILKQAFEELGKGSDESLASGIESGGNAKNAAENKVNEVKQGFSTASDTAQFGTAATNNFSQGILSGNVSGAAQQKGNEAKQGFKTAENTTDIGQTVGTNFASGIEAGGSAAPAAASNIAQETVSAFEPINTIPESVSTSMSEVVSATSDNMSQLPTIADEKINAVKTSFDNGFAQIKTATSSAMSEVKTIISSTDLSGVGANVVQGLINGMNSKLGEVRAVAAAIAAAVAAASKAKLDIHSPSRVFAEIGKNVMLGLVNGLEDNQYKAWYAMYNASEKLLDSERFYLKEKQRLEDEAFDKEYQEKLDNAKDSEEIEKIKQEYTAKAEEDGRDKYLEILKESSEEERRIYDDNLKAAEDSYKNILEKQKNFADKLAKQNDNLLYGTVTDSMNGFEFERSGITTTKQLKAYTASWKEYSELLDKIRNIDGLPKEVFEIFKDLNQKEGYGIAQDILKMNANGTLNEWIDAYTAATKAQADVSNNVFKDEAAELANALYDEFGEIPEEFMDFGTESADNFGKGFLNQIKTVIAGIKANVLANISSLMPTLALAGAGGNTSNTYNASYYIQPSAGESTQAQLLAIRSQEKINKYRMG